MHNMSLWKGVLYPGRFGSRVLSRKSISTGPDGLSSSFQTNRGITSKADTPLHRSTKRNERGVQFDSTQPTEGINNPRKASIYSTNRSGLTQDTSTQVSSPLWPSTFPANQNFGQSRHVFTGAIDTLAEDKAYAVETLSPNFDVTFDDWKTAFSQKSNWELMRALSVLWMCSFESVADHSLKLMSVSKRALGQTASDWLLKKTVYDQFVAGETPAEIRAAVGRMQAVSVGPLLAVPMEDDIHSQHPEAEERCDHNRDAILQSVTLARELDPHFPMIQMKMTAVLPADLCAWISQRCPKPSDSPHTVEMLAAALCGQPLDIDETFGAGLPDAMREHLQQGIQRVADVCKAAVAEEVMVMVDAEYTYLNPAINLLALAMMLVCNDPGARPPLVFYTYQNNLKCTWEILESDLDFLEGSGVGFAAKMVRGAYMSKERLLASQRGYADPVQDSYDATSAAYDAAVTSVLKRTAAHPSRHRMIVASHNEKSVLSAVEGMRQSEIDPSGGTVFFGQLMGMADHISSNLGVSGFLARKSLPYGSLAETLPYLSRRAQENKTVLAGARRERGLLTSELRCRCGI